jgi:uncharacterized protein (DUF1330 family)
MPAYVVAEIEVTNPDGYQQYIDPALASITQYGGKAVALAGATELVEGGPEPKRIVILEFADTAAAKRWYNSPEYQNVLPIRRANSRGRLFIVEGA